MDLKEWKQIIVKNTHFGKVMTVKNVIISVFFFIKAFFYLNFSSEKKV